MCVSVCVSVRERERGDGPAHNSHIHFHPKAASSNLSFLLRPRDRGKRFRGLRNWWSTDKSRKEMPRVRIPDKTQTLELPKHRKRANYVASFQVGQFFKVELIEVFGFD